MKFRKTSGRAGLISSAETRDSVMRAFWPSATGGHPFGGASGVQSVIAFSSINVQGFAAYRHGYRL